MNHYQVRYNKTRGQPGRGTKDHVWRIFENGKKEFLAKHVRINVPSWDEKTGEDWNISCDGYLQINRETSTASINKEQK